MDSHINLDPFLIADVVGGELTVVPKALFAAAGSLLGAKGGDVIPDSHGPSVVSTVEKYYSKMEIATPFVAEEVVESAKSWVQAQLSTPTTKRQYEQTLRDVGLSTKDSKILASKFNPQRDVESQEELLGSLKDLRALFN